MMKTIYICFSLITGLFFCFNNHSLSAQNSKRKGTEFGIKTGLNIAYTSGEGYDPRIGFNTGAFLDFNFSEQIFLRTAFEYSAKGAKGSVDYNDYPWYYSSGSDEIITFTGRYKNNLILHYLQLPVTLGYRLPLTDKINLTLNAGGYLSVGLASQLKTHIKGSFIQNDEMIPTDYKTNHTDWNYAGLERLDWGLIGGVGAEYKHFILNLNYEVGLRPLNSGITYQYEDYGSSYPNSGSIIEIRYKRWYNYNFSLSLGYKF